MNECSGFSTGMTVKISDNPQKSINLFTSLNGYKRTLRNTIQKIKKIEESSKGTRIFIVPPPNCKYRRISFHPDDINIYSKKRIKIKPEIFDPDNLI